MEEHNKVQRYFYEMNYQNCKKLRRKIKFTIFGIWKRHRNIQSNVPTKISLYSLGPSIRIKLNRSSKDMGSLSNALPRRRISLEFWTTGYHDEKRAVSRASRRHVRFNQYANTTDTNYTEALRPLWCRSADCTTRRLSTADKRESSRRVLGRFVVLSGPGKVNS